MDALTRRVSLRFASYFSVGDIILFGKYKNKKGKIVAFGQDHHGNPTVEIEPIPKGRKQNKVFGLFRIWKAENKTKFIDQDEQAGTKEASRSDYRTWAPYVPKTADLNPPLGKPGGPCHVVKRIVDRIKSPAQKQELIEDVESGEPLSNPDASKVYRIENERGAGLVNHILITAHAQYRMDLRSVTVADVQAAMASFSKQLIAWKEQGSKAFDHYAGMLERQERIEWIDPRTKLDIVFQMVNGDTVRLVTTYWKGRPDPRPTSDCAI